MKDAYELLKRAQELWQQNAMSMNNAGSLKKENRAIRLCIKAPEYGIWDATNVYYDEYHGIVIEAQIEPYTSKE